MRKVFLKWLTKHLVRILFKVADKLWGDVIEVAKPIITSLGNTSLSNIDKHKAAFENVKSNFKAKGIELKDNFINFVIVLIVQEFKIK